VLLAFWQMTGEAVSLAQVRRHVMRMKSLCLQSARISVAVMLAGALPAAAQSYGHTPQVSTPAERVQTQQLNDQAIDGTTQPPAALNGEAAPQQMAQSDQQTYEDQQQQYQDQQQQYQQQRAQYHEDRRQYVRDVRRYDLARYEWSDYPRVYVYRYEAPNLQRLYLIADPTHLLAQVPVEGPSGRFIGKVRNVETAPDGRPRRVEIALNRVVSVWVTPGHFRYDPDEHVLFTDLTRDGLWTMPGATVESGLL
jgi:hypothetical protein